MTTATSILPQKLHEYPQQDVIDGSGGESALIWKTVLLIMKVYCNFCIVMPAEHFVLPGSVYALMKVHIIPITWMVQGLMKFGWAVLSLS